MATVACAFPFLPPRARQSLKARWSGQLLKVLGLRLHVAGTPPASGFLVANHISWLDIYVINALAPAAFVSKDDVRAWPVIGWLSRRTETIFLERGSRGAAMRAKEHLVEELRRGTCVAVFPEGTTTAGDVMLPFHSALFQAAIDAGVSVAPIAIRYEGRDGERAPAPAYAGDTTLWQSLRAIVAASGLTAHVSFLQALEAAGGERRHLAQHAHRLIASRLARSGADTAVETRDDLPGVSPSGCRPTGSPCPAPEDSLPA